MCPPKPEKVRWTLPFNWAEEATGEDAIDAAIAFCEAKGVGQGVTSYRLRDWGLAASATGAAPIPVVHCDDCGVGAREKGKPPRRLPRDVELRRARQPARPAPDLGRDAPAPLRQAGQARNRHDGHVRRFVVVFRPLHRAPRRHADRPGRGVVLDERRPSTSAASSTRSCTSCIPASSPARCRSAATCPKAASNPSDALFTQGMVTHAIYQTRDAQGRPVYHYPEEVALRDGKGFLSEGRRRGGDHPLRQDVQIQEQRRRPGGDHPGTGPIPRAGSCCPTARPSATWNGPPRAPRPRSGTLPACTGSPPTSPGATAGRPRPS